MLVLSATISRDRFGCVQVLHLRTRAGFGARVHYSNTRFRYVLTLWPGTRFYLRRSDVPAADVLAFAIIVLTAKRTGTRYPGIPSLLDVVLRDATSYFVLIFACQLCLVFFLFFAPVRDLRFAWTTAILPCSHSCMLRRQYGSCPDCRFISLT